MPSGSTAVNPLQAVFLRLLRYRRYSSLTVAGQSRDGSPTGLSGTLPVLLAEQQRKDNGQIQQTYACSGFKTFQLSYQGIQD